MGNNVTDSKADFVLVTALEEELTAVLDRLPGYQQLPPTEADIRTYYQVDLPVTFPDFSTGAYRIIVMPLLGMGRVQAGAATADAIKQWRPRYVLMVGIAGGITARNVRIGDILISDQIVDYELQKLTPDGPEIRWQVQQADPRLLNACHNLRSGNWHELIQSGRPDGMKPERHFGPVASGDKVIAFGEVLAKYRNVWPKLIGVEMEASGVATVASQSSDKPGFFMVRGVSDLADEDKGSSGVEKWRAYACAVAASFVVELLKSGPVPLSPKSRLKSKQVELILEGEFSEFDSNRQQDIVGVLAALLKIDARSIRILTVSQGSIVIRLEMPDSAANRLYEMATKRDFRLMSLGLQSVLVEGRGIANRKDFVTNVSGGTNFRAQVGDINIGGDVAGRDIVKSEAPPVGVTSLHQLPPPPRDFVGREKELAELLAQVENEGVTVFCLQGTGGVGKTALARVLADRLARRYPNAQFYLDLQGGSGHPLSAAKIMTRVIRAYYPTAQLPNNEAELPGQYQSVLHGQRALLVMDNADDRWQVEPLVPPPSCCLLVTSRQHFDLPGLYPKNLDILSTGDARELLLKITPRIDGRADEIAKLCGYLPLALRPVASLLKMRQDLTLDECIKKLSDRPQRLEFLLSAANRIDEPSVDAALAASYNLLNGDLQKLWRTLAVLSDEFGAAEAGAIWGLDLEAANERLGDLTMYSLIEYNENAGRWHFHDLVQVFAEQRPAGDKQERQEVLGNIVRSLGTGSPRRQELARLFAKRLHDPDWRDPDWQLTEIRPTVLEALWDLVDGASRPKERLEAALELLSLHWWSEGTNTMGIQRMLAFLELVTTAADTPTQRQWLIECISPWLNLELDVRQRVQLYIYRAALQAQLYQFRDKAGRDSTEGQQLSAAAKQDYDAAEKLIRPFIDSQEALPEDYRQLARIYMGKGNLAIMEAEICPDAKRSNELRQKAVDFYLAALKAARAYSEFSPLVVENLEQLCYAYAQLQKWIDAEQYYSEALRLLELIKTLSSRAYALLYFLVQDSAAQMYYAWAETLKEDKPNGARGYDNARRLTLEAIAQLEQHVGDSEELAMAYFNVGECLQALHNLDEAGKYWQRAREVAHRRGIWYVEQQADQRLKSLGR